MDLEYVSYWEGASPLVNDVALKGIRHENNRQSEVVGVFGDTFTSRKQTSRIFKKRLAVLGIWIKHRKCLLGKVGFSCTCGISLPPCLFSPQQLKRRHPNMENNALVAFKVLGHHWYTKVNRNGGKKKRNQTSILALLQKQGQGATTAESVFTQRCWKIPDKCSRHNKES